MTLSFSSGLRLLDEEMTVRSSAGREMNEGRRDVLSVHVDLEIAVLTRPVGAARIRAGVLPRRRIMLCQHDSETRQRMRARIKRT